MLVWLNVGKLIASMLTVAMLCVVTLSVIMLGVFTLIVVMLSATYHSVVLSDVAPYYRHVLLNFLLS